MDAAVQESVVRHVAKEFAAKRDHALITPAPFPAPLVMDLVRVSDIYRRGGTFAVDGYGDALADGFVTLSARFAAASQTIYDADYRSNRAHNLGLMRGYADALAALCSHVLPQLPDQLIMPISKAADLEGDIRKTLDNAHAAPRRSYFRMVLADDPYRTAAATLAIGPVIPSRNKKTAFPLKLITIMS